VKAAKAGSKTEEMVSRPEITPLLCKVPTEASQFSCNWYTKRFNLSSVVAKLWLR